MKLLTLTALLFFFCSEIQSQELGKIKPGIKAGYNYTFSNYVANTSLPTKPFHGGYAGLLLKVPFENRLFFVPQVDVSYRGMSTDSLRANLYSKISEFHFRVMPLFQIDFKHPDKKENTLFVQFGPSIGFGITGKQEKQDGNNRTVKSNLKYGFQAYGRYDAHWHTGIGYETKNGFRLLGEFALGLGNMINTEDGPDLKYNTISLGIAYLFVRN